ncbi:hypothetical protein POM88_006557 [Heracleum sosnowskyi]|uniref:Uncharacterized protein n=1 Tax=Heracleum sosnowskyi TaxID=360622 RepID=A0AAD8N4V3_9APIA|nr:hypothetical protein POM88_006557 [Heracleum sosnowskyi]
MIFVRWTSFQVPNNFTKELFHASSRGSSYPGKSLIATVFKFVENPENNEKPMDQKSRVKFKIMSLKVNGPMDYVHSGKSTSSNRKESDCLKEGSNKRHKQKVQFGVNVPRTSKQFWTHENNVIPMQNIGLENCNAWNSEVVTQLRNSEVVWRIVMLGILV